jgi:hypothetical protein
MMSELRHLIREILTEELGKVHEMQSLAPRITEEQVSIRTNAELLAFVQRLLAVAQDGRMRADIEAGRHIFRLVNGGTPQLQAYQPTAPAPQSQTPVRFERGLVSERDVVSLPQGTRCVYVGKSVRFTPLARDELRRRGIKVERAKS